MTTKPSANMLDTDVPTAAEITALETGKSDTSHNHAGVYEPADPTIIKSADLKWEVVTSGPHNASPGDRIIADMTGGAFTINLPGLPGAGDHVTIITYDTSTNALTVGRGGENINGSAADHTPVSFTVTRYVYVDATIGWSANTSVLVDLSGNLVVAGTVDGRDVAADGATLDTLVSTSVGLDQLYFFGSI